jgi:hypothetical protein
MPAARRRRGRARFGRRIAGAASPARRAGFGEPDDQRDRLCPVGNKWTSNHKLAHERSVARRGAVSTIGQLGPTPLRVIWRPRNTAAPLERSRTAMPSSPTWLRAREHELIDARGVEPERCSYLAQPGARATSGASRGARAARESPSANVPRNDGNRSDVHAR